MHEVITVCMSVLRVVLRDSRESSLVFYQILMNVRCESAECFGEFILKGVFSGSGQHSLRSECSD